MQQQATNPTAIDFKASYAQAKALSKLELQLKCTTPMNAFNLLQDMRHLIILDLRPEEQYAAGHIRKSINTNLSGYQKELSEAILLKEKQHRFKSHYEADDLLRVLFVFPPESFDECEKAISSELKGINQLIMDASGGFHRLSKAFYLKEFEGAFDKKYPYVCVNAKSEERWQVLAESRFPSELKKDKLFIGNMMNILSNDYKQLTMLGI